MGLSKNLFPSCSDRVPLVQADNKNPAKFLLSSIPKYNFSRTKILAFFDTLS